MNRIELIAAQVINSDGEARDLATEKMSAQAHAVGYRLTTEPYLISSDPVGRTYAAIARRTIRHWLPKRIGGTR